MRLNLDSIPIDSELYRVVHQVEQGEEIIIYRDGIDVARIAPIQPSINQRTPGQDKGLVIIHDDFEDPLPSDVLDAFFHPTDPC
jgi:antitoxin (DNA-binding transcriptional repressor) of toxin-antitoxin stability system